MLASLVGLCLFRVSSKRDGAQSSILLSVIFFEVINYIQQGLEPETLLSVAELELKIKGACTNDYWVLALLAYVSKQFKGESKRDGVQSSILSSVIFSKKKKF